MFHFLHALSLCHAHLFAFLLLLFASELKNVGSARLSLLTIYCICLGELCSASRLKGEVSRWIGIMDYENIEGILPDGTRRFVKSQRSTRVPG